MRYWTVQSSDVVRIIQQKGIYLPDFTKSTYLQKQEKLGALYKVILNSFNEINDLSGRGVVFSFYGYDYKAKKKLENVDDFLGFVESHQDVLKSLWDELNVKGNFLLELENDSLFLNTLMMDIDDFQFLMPPIITWMPPYNESDITRIVNNIQRGQMPRTKMNSGVTQAHLPYIQRDQIKNIYSL